MNFFRILILFAAVSFFMISCSDDGPTKDNGESDNYFSMEAGSYWVNDNYEVNSEGNIEESYYQDSTVILEKKEYEGKDAIYMDTFEDGESQGMMIMSESDNEIFIRAEDIFPEDFGFGLEPEDLPTGWIVLYEKNRTSWFIIDDIEVNDLEFNDFKMDVTFSMNGKKAGTESVTINGKSYTADKMQMITEINAKINAGIGVIPLDININTYFYFVKGYGIVKTYTEPTEFGIPGLFTEEIEGSISTTIKMEMK